MLLAAKQAQDHTGLSRYMLERHGPPSVRVGDRLYWRKADLDAWLGAANDDRSEHSLMDEINALTAHEIR